MPKGTKSRVGVRVEVKKISVILKRITYFLHQTARTNPDFAKKAFFAWVKNMLFGWLRKNGGKVKKWTSRVFIEFIPALVFQKICPKRGGGINSVNTPQPSYFCGKTPLKHLLQNIPIFDFFHVPYGATGKFV